MNPDGVIVILYVHNPSD